MTTDDGFRIRKTEIDSLLRTDVIDFYQHLNFFNESIEAQVKKAEFNKLKNGKG